ncbi:MAG: Unknown protein [uncultured Campylobacterales bacterium]|uniref:Uncharacterized protein n=1 Tax=uncultured Campylobacterales bacterium TaxID=352960 RepID=A0A6S6SXL4_9BACT|nr:MAG: Unknown protein [uncultured Campylobacterales bacterium]
MKNIVFLIFLTIFLSANNQALRNKITNEVFKVDTDQIFKELRDEVGIQRFQDEYNIIRNEQNFKKALINLKQTVLAKHQRNLNKDALSMPNFKDALKNLEASLKVRDSFITSHLALKAIYTRYWMNDIAINKQYTLLFAESAYNAKICSGYLYYALMTKEITRSIEKSVSIYKEGTKNCKDKYIQREIALKYHKYKYIVKNNIPLYTK